MVAFQEFTASDSCPRKTENQVVWRSTALHGEVGDVNIAALQTEIDATIKLIVEIYGPEHAYNIDETGL